MGIWPFRRPSGDIALAGSGNRVPPARHELPGTGTHKIAGQTIKKYANIQRETQKSELVPVSGRRLFLLLILLGAVALPLLMASLGSERIWHLWNIPTMQPCFAEARAITAGAESRRAGFDPLVANPADPWHRVMNYPRQWQVLFRLGLDQGSTVAVALVMIAVFLAGLLLFVDRIDRTTACLLALALFSPAVMLGVERGNICLLIFFLCASALAALRRSAVVAALLLTTAGTLMYYPFLGLACLARAPRRLCVWLVGPSLVVGVAYLALTWRDVVRVLEGLDRGTFLSYGLNVGWMATRQLHGSQAAVWAVAILSVLLLGGAVATMVRSARRRLRPAAAPDLHHLDGFRLGAAIYAGTFLLGNNWDYRLMFALFCLPQLSDWTRDGHRGFARVARLTLGALLASLWMQFFFRFGRFMPGGGYVLLALDETANWALLGGLLYLLPAARPEWLWRRPAPPGLIAADAAA